MLSSITLPRVSDVGWRLKEAFAGQLFIQLDGSGWASDPVRCFAVAPAQQIESSATCSTSLWQHWNEAWQQWAAQVGDINADFAVQGPLPGWYGYLGYEAGRASPRSNASGMPLATIGMPLAAIGFFPCVVLEFSDRLELRFLDSHRALADEICHAMNDEPDQQVFSLLDPFRPDSDFSAYQQAFERIIAYILAGDCYQVNFAQRFSAHFAGDPYAAFQRIQQSMQSPFSGYVSHPCGSILSFSPEQFLSIRQQQLTTTPIKGTRPRSSNAAEDANLREALRHSEKDRAENLMIVDLLRNDLSKVAVLGSVAVPKLFEIDSFAHVHHMISTVEARLLPGFTAIQVLEACFPGGSITGAPKHRACEIIRELEPESRSVYCGSLFYADIGGNMQSNILIRTVLAEHQKMYCWGGGGIVADSECQSEYDETLHKVGQLMQLFRFR